MHKIPSTFFNLQTENSEHIDKPLSTIVKQCLLQNYNIFYIRYFSTNIHENVVSLLDFEVFFRIQYYKILL